MAYKKVEIDGRGWGPLRGTPVLLTDSLAEKLDEGAIQRLKEGRAVRGLKHLVQAIKAFDKDAVLVLTDDKTARSASQFFVNLEAYRAFGQGPFFEMYRRAGRTVARRFLGDSFPKEFPQSKEPDELSGTELRKAGRNADQVLNELTRTATKRKRLLRTISRELEELRQQKRLLRSELNELDGLRRQSSISYYMEKLAELEERFAQNHHETRGKNSWQAWIYQNNWVMGTLYKTPIERVRISFDSIPDFLFPTIDGYLDILEIKRPSHLVVRQDGSHPGSFAWSSDCNQAIGQVANYIHWMELNQLALTKCINEKYAEKLGEEITVLRPRGFVLIGNSDNWSAAQREALRKLNHTLHGIEVLTYSDIVRRAKRLIELYSDHPSAAVA